MNTKLNHVQDWTALAKEANWSPNNLAKLCNVSLRTLQRGFIQATGISPKKWLVKQRQEHAAKLLRQGFSVKEVAASLNYNHSNQFSREFALFWGCSPSRWCESLSNGVSQLLLY